MTEQEVVDLLEQTGPLTGSQLAERTHMEVLHLWYLCRRAGDLRFDCVSRRFLRLDRVVPGYARLSPSIRREFLTYTLLGLQDQRQQLEERAAALHREIREISEAKLTLARASMQSAIDAIPEADLVCQKVCFIIAGDIIYNMSHRVPRPERSTGEMVRGSDLDIVAVAEDDLPMEVFRALDRAIFKKKHFLLTHPDYREEIDYLIKDLAKVRIQLEFDTFQHMVASKILDEGSLLCGSPAVFRRIKDLLEKYGIPGKLRRLEEQATANRAAAEKRLLAIGPGLSQDQAYHLFYTREESEEIF